jgi:hypothetical protein
MPVKGKVESYGKDDRGQPAAPEKIDRTDHRKRAAFVPAVRRGGAFRPCGGEVQPAAGGRTRD